MDLSRYDNYKILDAMLAIAEITELEFSFVCRTNLTTWWGILFDRMILSGESPLPFRKYNAEGENEKIKYKGALVLDPIKGLYRDVIVEDAEAFTER